MFEANYLICFDCVLVVPGLMPLLVVNNKLKQDLKEEKIGDSKRRARSLDPSPVFGTKSCSGWEGWEGKSSICVDRMLGSLKAKNQTNGNKEAAMRSSKVPRGRWLKPWGRGRGRGKPFPRGFREGDLPLNHLSPKGWWDSITALICMPGELRIIMVNNAITELQR